MELSKWTEAVLCDLVIVLSDSSCGRFGREWHVVLTVREETFYSERVSVSSSGREETLLLSVVVILVVVGWRAGNC